MTDLGTVLDRFDALNRQDPVLETGEQGQQPRALLYGRRMSRMLERVNPGASDALQLAARAQHLCRFEIPRDTFPAGRQGYHRWRIRVRRHQSDRAAKVLEEHAFDAAIVARVRGLIEKQNLTTDPEAQMLEDVACLVFLQYYLEPFAAGQSDTKMIDILKKTMRKMSISGRAWVQNLSLAATAQLLVEQAAAEFAASGVDHGT